MVYPILFEERFELVGSVLRSPSLVKVSRTPRSWKKLGHGINQGCGPTLPDVDVKPVTKTIYHHDIRLAMELEVVAADVMERVIWDYWRDRGHAGLTWCN